MASVKQRRPGSNHVKSSVRKSMKNAVPSHGCLTGAVDITDAGASRNPTRCISLRGRTRENAGVQTLSGRGNER